MIRLVLLVVLVGLLGTSIIRLLERQRLERIARLRAAFLAVPSEPTGPSAVKEVRLRDATVCFRVPQTWAEEYPDEESAVFTDRGGSRRALHVTSTIIPVSPAPLAEAVRARAEGPTTVETLPSGTVLVKAVSQARDREGDVAQFTWWVGHALSPERARLVRFTLNAPFATAHDVLTRTALVRLEQEVRAAQIAGA